MRIRLKQGTLVASTNKARLGLSRRFNMNCLYREVLTGNVIIKTSLKWLYIY